MDTVRLILIDYEPERSCRTLIQSTLCLDSGIYLVPGCLSSRWMPVKRLDACVVAGCLSQLDACLSWMPVQWQDFRLVVGCLSSSWMPV